ncbi:hypothetical protein MUK42_33056 [Musa troglodytarum]|uniref:Uncharacterized protein n=1 Tax=Musa troglodytarum TaxID=320322 RepID=A0A9E7JS42_9LILI|nr:hypothetical protein MUK42_33056 [Musa troglodytarum]
MNSRVKRCPDSFGVVPLTSFVPRPFGVYDYAFNNHKFGGNGRPSTVRFITAQGRERAGFDHDQILITR